MKGQFEFELLKDLPIYRFEMSDEPSPSDSFTNFETSIGQILLLDVNERENTIFTTLPEFAGRFGLDKIDEIEKFNEQPLRTFAFFQVRLLRLSKVNTRNDDETTSKNEDHRML